MHGVRICNNASGARPFSARLEERTMSEDKCAEPAIEPLLVLTVETKLVHSVMATPLGDRTIFDVVGGRFAGAGLAGRVPACGGDWVTRTVRGSQLDVRLLLETDDGVSILFRYTGKASLRGEQPRIEVAGSFDAPDGVYGWLNDIQAFGLGTPLAAGVRYQFFRFR
jgi:Protein of unknown function (DUF3237)